MKGTHGQCEFTEHFAKTLDLLSHFRTVLFPEAIRSRQFQSGCGCHLRRPSGGVAQDDVRSPNVLDQFLVTNGVAYAPTSSVESFAD